MSTDTINYEALLLSELDEATWLTDLSSNEYLVLCPNVAAIYGHRAKAFYDDPDLFYKAIHADDREVVKASFSPLYKEPGQQQQEYRLYDSDGKMKWVLEKRKTFGQDGRLLMLGIVRDITEKRMALDKLSESEASLKAIFDNSLQSFLLLDKNYRIRAFNKIARERAKMVLDADLEVGKSMLDIIGDDSRAAFKSSCDRALSGQYLRNEDKMHIGSDIHWFELHFAPTTSDTGEITGVFHAATDITNKKISEEKLRNSEEQYRQLVENARDGICIIKDGKIAYANPRLLELWGGSLAKIEGRPLADFVEEEYVDVVSKYYDDRMEGPDAPEQYELKLRNKDNQPLPAELSAGRITYGDGVASLVIIRDLTERMKAQQAIMEAESKFRSLVEQSLTGIYIIAGSEIKYMNPWLMELFGFSNLDYPGRKYTVMDFVHPDDRTLVAENIKKRLEGTEKEMKYQFRGLDKDGNVRHVEVHGNRAVYEGEPAIIGTLVDITDRYNAEQKLRESEEKYRHFFEEDITGDFMSTPEGELLDCNRRYIEILGYESKEDIRKVDAHDFYQSPAMREIFLEDLNRKGQLKHYVVELKKKNGESVIVEENVLADRDEDGNIKTIRGYLYDITDRVRAEARLKESEQRLKLAINASHIGLYDVDIPSGRVVVNDKYAVIYEQDPATFEQSMDRWMECIHEEDRRGVANTVQNLNNVHLDYSMEYRVITAHGNLKWLHDSGRVVALNDDNTPKRMLGTILDISEQKLAEVERLKLINELTQQNTNLKQFSYIVSHNLRKPVANLSGLMEMIASYDEPMKDIVELKRVMGMISRSVNELEEVIIDLDQILVVRHGAGKQYEKISIESVIGRAKKLLKAEIEHAQAKISTELKVRKIRVIKSYIHSIFYNLISNALKYSRPGSSPEIQITTTRKDGEVILKVTDYGVGMDLKKDGPKLFNLYSRLNMTKEGRGVGLFLVKTQVEFMNGRIEVESEPNKGTTFTIYLPEEQPES